MVLIQALMLELGIYVDHLSARTMHIDPQSFFYNSVAYDQSLIRFYKRTKIMFGRYGCIGRHTDKHFLSDLSQKTHQKYAYNPFFLLKTKVDASIVHKQFSQ